MKKLIAMMLTVVMVLSLLAGCGSKAEQPSEPAVAAGPASAMEVFETVWGLYAEDEQFAAEMTQMDEPGYLLLIPEDLLANVDENAVLVHMMNANTFTGGVVHLNGVDVETYAKSLRDAIQSNQWICGFPETMIVVDLGGNYVLSAFGVNDAMNPFMAHLDEAYPNAEYLYKEAIA